MPFLVVNSPEENIWETNPSLDLITEFRSFRKKHGDDHSSDVIKAIFYIWDPKSDLRDSGMTHEEIVDDINTNLLGDKDFDWDAYGDIRDTYMSVNISPLEARLNRYKNEIDGLDRMLQGWSWNKSDVKNRADAVKAYKELMEQYIEIADKVKMEHDDNYEMMAGYQKSMVENVG